MHAASANGMTEIVMLLLEMKCDTNVADDYGNTSLIYAARNKKMTIARELAWSLCDLKMHGHFPDASHGRGKTAAERAKEEGHHALAEYLTCQAPREQVRFASCAYDAMTHSSTRLFSAWL